ncbi:MAG TPA: adenosylcobinamide-GDP ribazoletransferase [Methanospirillum sp.]|nr:adenosylcobinamide-GDP ribazoletransferase [Methanospirillum sp.]
MQIDGEGYLSMRLTESVRALLQFTTIIPLGRTAPFEAFAERIWLYPLAGYVTGCIAGAVFWALPVPPLARAAIAIGILFLITGCNHLDGLMDLGDGLMAHGSRERRIRALTDRTIGTGGIALGMTITLISVGSLTSLTSPAIGFGALILSEVAGKYAMAVMTIFGRPFHDGLHAALHLKTRPWFIIPATFLFIPAVWLCAGPLQFLAVIIGAITVPLSLIYVAGRLFGGVNGDVTGASGEITRAVVLVIMVSMV